MQSQLIVHLSILAAVVILMIAGMYVIERYTTKQRLNVQKIALDMLCCHAALFVAGAIDRSLNWQGDFVQLVILILVGLLAFGVLGAGWTYPAVKVKK